MQGDIHTSLQPYTTVSVDPAAKGTVVISATNYNYPRTNTQSPNLDVSKFNASIPLEKLHPWPYENRQHIALHNPPKVQGTIPSLGWAYHHVAYT